MHYTSPYPPLPPLPEQNVHDFIFGSPALTAPEDKLLLVDPLSGRRWHRNEFKERVYDAATALLTPASEGGVGLGPEGEMVAIMSTNCFEYVALLHACFRAAVPVSLIPSGATAFELEHLFRTSEATRLFIHPSLLPQALDTAHKFGLTDDRIFLLEGHAEGRKSLADLIREVRVRKFARAPSRPVQRDALAYLVYSSGTSGLPKAVMVSHRNVIASLVQVAVATEFEGPDPVLEKTPIVALAFLPMYHTYGLHYGCIRPVLSVITTVIIPRWNADLVLDLIPKFRISFLPMTPPAILQLVNHRRIREVDLSSLVVTGSGAAHLPPKLASLWKSYLKNVEAISEGFGMSECTISATRAVHKKLGKPRPGSTGVLLPGVEARIVKDDGTLAGPNEPGELWLRGPNVALGYWRNPQATEATFGGGWLRTGDRFRVDEDGQFFFVERTKDILKVSGAQVSPTEIENALLANPDKLVSDVTVAGVSGGRTSDEKVPRAWVVLSDEGRKRGEQVVVQTLLSWVQKNLSKYKWLRGGIEVVNEIPKNPTGKVLRRVLQDRYEQQLKAPQAKL
ncbi:acetyl-CoA synthetase-like protein [Dichomitus squalens LYAD-421 SS1]|uniref:acetyl-CoA synthetase-like protein n=1 Tax=Dichomitus squalens (strain LYAD-421) TaxID=732165 RepID=UPI0004411377|nr:acetyl-CoA synthetase-like protein [Dichomitus squalens LYAD-421 SS1]EJF63384.1 acetyl-CoA synthetase-like protein [Dichomitus squalens LYAD-421 SS1]